MSFKIKVKEESNHAEVAENTQSKFRGGTNVFYYTSDWARFGLVPNSVF